MILYSVPVSLYCAKTRILLRHKGIPFEERPPEGGYGAEAHKRLVPSGNLPALLVGELVLCDSETIAEYLEETHPEPPMLPGDAAHRARIRDLSRFHDTRLEPALRRWFPHVAPGERDLAAVEAGTAEVGRRLQQLAALLAMGPGQPVLTLGDCGFAVTFPWIELLADALGQPVPWPKAIEAYRARLESHPAVAAELTAYRPAMERWVAEKQGV